jgi:hypothetical protein
MGSMFFHITVYGDFETDAVHPEKINHGILLFDGMLIKMSFALI